MNTEQQSETYTAATESYTTTTEARDPSSEGRDPRREGRVKWSRPADFAWGGGASILTALLLWLLFGASPASVAAPVVTAPTAGAVVAANEPIIVAGSAAPNQRITIVGNDQPMGDVTAGTDGSFSYEISSLEPGAYNVAARAVDDAGQEVAVSAPVTFTVTGPRVAAPVAVLPEDQMPVVYLPEGGLAFDENDPRTISGAGVPGSTITILNGATPLIETLVDTAGQWALQLPALDPGAYRLTLRQRLPDGQEVTLAEPLAVSFAGLEVPQVVMPVEGLHFAPGQPITLEGAGVPGATITVSDAAGNTLGAAPVDAAGTWSLTLPALPAGDYTWTVTQTTAEGQETASAEPLAITVSEEPAAGAATAIPADGQPVVISPPPDAPQPAGRPITLEGAGAPGAMITVSDAAGNTLGAAPVDAAGTWSLTLPALPAGDYTWTVTQTTAEGQETASAEPLAITVSEEPAAGAATAIPADGQPVVISPPPDAPQPAGQPITLEGAGVPGATITVSDEAGQPLGKAIVDAAGTWALTLPALPAGDYAWTVTQTTAEGQETASAEPLAITVSEEPAAGAATAIPADGQPVVISPPPDALQPAGQPITLEGAGVPGATITVSDEAGQPLGKAIVDAAGMWALTLPALPAGDYTWTVTQTTAEGIETELPAPLALTVAAPAAPPDVVLPEVTKPGTDLNAVAGAPIPLEGIGQPGATITISEGATVLAEVQVGPTGAWQAETTDLTPGAHRLTLTQTTGSGAQIEAALPVSVMVVGAPAAAPAAAQPAQVIRGGAPAGASVEVYAGDALLGTATANARGVWQLTLPPGLSFKPDELTIKAFSASGAPLGEGEASILLDAPATLPVTGGRWWGPWGALSRLERNHHAD